MIRDKAISIFTKAMLICALLLIMVSTVTADETEVIKVMTSDAKVFVGEVVEEREDAMVIKSIADDQHRTVKYDHILRNYGRLSEQDIIKSTNLPVFTSWHIAKRAADRPLEIGGKIASVTPTLIYVNLGKDDGVTTGQTLNVYRIGSEIRDPDTDELLGRSRTKIGELEVVEVLPNVSKTKLISDGELAPEAGDEVAVNLKPFRIAVLPFVDDGGQYGPTGLVAAERFTTELARRDIAVVERTLMSELLKEIVLQNTSLFDPKTAGKIGKQTGASHVLTGRLTGNDNKVETHVRLIDVETGQILDATSGQVNLSDVSTRTDVSSSKAVKEKKEMIENSVGMTLIYVHPGTFLMGSPIDEPGRQQDETQHPVRLTQGFHLGQTEVTQVQWQRVMGGSNPSSQPGPSRPVHHITWKQAVDFCNKLSRKEGRRYRLPTEAEWEYACRAGTTTPFFTGKTLPTSHEVHGGSKTQPVASGRPNPWGFYDMHGNVREYCADWYAGYPDGLTVNPKGPARGEFKVSRGGSWQRSDEMCRSAYRIREDPNKAPHSAGFRVVLDVD